MVFDKKRRDFIRNMSMAGLTLRAAPAFSVRSLIVGEPAKRLENRHFTITADTVSGRVNVMRRDGAILLDNATSRANLLTGRRSLAESGYHHQIEIRETNDNIGPGKQMIINSHDESKKIDFAVSYTVYDSISAIFISATCKNISGKPFVIKSIEPLCATEEAGASLHWNPALKVLTNGPMYYDAGIVHDFGDNYTEPEPYGPVKGASPSPDFRYPSGNRVRSWWNAAIFSGYDKEALVLGYPDNQRAFGQIILSKTLSGNLSLYTESLFAGTRVLKPGQAISAGRFMINISNDPYTALEGFAEIMGKVNKSRSSSPLNGWCSWFYTYEFVTEDEVLRNAEFVSKHLQNYGLDYIQIDEGFQKYHGEWEGNERFPHGMKWLAGRIKDYGLKPGLWLAPFVISEPAEVYINHPEWLLRKADGKLMRVGPWPDENSDWAKNENPKRYGLDISHPGAQKWLYDLFDRAANDWGYEMFKIDFVAWSLLSAQQFYDSSYTPASAYRKGMEIIRAAIGDRKHINDCGPGPVSVGLIDSMRIESDQNYGFADAAWKQYFLESSSSAPASAKRYYFNKRAWINDADHLCISRLSLTQSQAAATIIGLSGGNVISGDRLSDLDNSRLEILRKVLPSYGEAAKPADLFDTDRHSVFALRIKKPFGEWTIAAFFNSGTDQVSRKVDLRRLWLDESKKYIVYDFWKESLFGEITRSLDLTLQPEGVTLLAIHEKRDVPQFLSSDRHILQGAVETDEIIWDESSGTLRGISSGPRQTSYNVFVYMPESISWKQGQQSLYRDYPGYSIRQTAPQVIRVHLSFGDFEKIEWAISFR